ncbi:hypothetical protein M378DRAFT_156379 [Amanita muscaria Koide BX008]|uniref:Urease accessory protein UreF n=1 Tax=Amanita muscaria (strain Koide BX008) TaxID=946122 RepID=A0A0C2XL75_AMAMK|nr:hypothetical protein M378DRAFT_156379 [Amanita muscaria Koide BX008]
MDQDDETYILLLLSDSNLPTGSFVASSGLESFFKHGFASLFPTTEHALIDFIRQSLASYAHSALPFVADAHCVLSSAKDSESILDETIHKLLSLDQLYEASTLNHVTRRASTAQGVALLALYSKAFCTPSELLCSVPSQSPTFTSKLIDEFKLLVRREETPGHLPVCWGILTAALGLSLERAQYLHLFLHARGLLSAAVRLNDIGPYRAQQLLLHVVRPLVAAALSRCAALRTGLLEGEDSEFDVSTHGPANTWPLGELMAARHDLQYSRVFNS